MPVNLTTGSTSGNGLACYIDSTGSDYKRRCARIIDKKIEVNRRDYLKEIVEDFVEHLDESGYA